MIATTCRIGHRDLKLQREGFGEPRRIQCLSCGEAWRLRRDQDLNGSCPSKHRTVRIERFAGGEPARVECLSCRDTWTVLALENTLEAFGGGDDERTLDP